MRKQVQNVYKRIKLCYVHMTDQGHAVRGLSMTHIIILSCDSLSQHALVQVTCVLQLGHQICLRYLV